MAPLRKRPIAIRLLVRRVGMYRGLRLQTGWISTPAVVLLRTSQRKSKRPLVLHKFGFLGCRFQMSLKMQKLLHITSIVEVRDQRAGCLPLPVEAIYQDLCPSLLSERRIYKTPISSRISLGTRQPFSLNTRHVPRETKMRSLLAPSILQTKN